MLLSLVIVVSRHQAWIRPCLRSILDQAPTDLDVVVVDNASPDHTPRILDEAAGGDPRVRVRRTESRLSTPAARELGLDVARGDYVWFFDPVALLLPNAFALLDDSLAEQPDVVLVTETVRDLYGGDRHRTGPAGSTPVMRDRLARREHLLAIDRPATGGDFADVPLATAVLARAASTARVPAGVYAYRELPPRVVRQWANGDPFDVFPAYDRAFDELREPSSGTARAELADAMLHHLRALHPSVGPGRRADFFREMSRRVHAQHDVLPRPRGRAARAELEAVEKGRFQLYLALRRRGRFRALRSVRRAVGKIPRNRATVRSRSHQAFYALQRRRPLWPDQAVYTAYWGSAYSCNPRAIYEKARELEPSVRGTWVVKPGSEGVMPDDVSYVVEGTRDYYRLMARATYFVNNANFPNDIVKRPGQVHLQTHHGTPLKTMGLDLVYAKHSSMGLNFRRLMKRVERWDYSISANEFTTEIWERVYPSGTYESLETGYPRNDVLATATSAHRERVRTELGIEPEQTAVLYTPTHREYSKEYVAFLDAEKLAEDLGPDHVVLMRTHYFYGPGEPTGRSARVRDVADHPSIEDLAIASDVLVTDYSSLMFDYAVLDRPIVIFAPDWETYRTERGTYFDLMAEPPGAVAVTQDELTKLLLSGATSSPENEARRRAFRSKFTALEDGHAAERVVRRLWPGLIA